MTRAEWFACESPFGLAAALSPFVDQRRARLVVAACGRRVWDHLGDPVRFAVAAGERLADGAADPAEVERGVAAAEVARQHETAAFGSLTARIDQLKTSGELSDFARLPFARAELAAQERRLDAVRALQSAVRPDLGVDEVLHGLHLLPRADACDLLRCAYPPLGHWVEFLAAWRTSVADGMARSMYESRDFSPMPALADALEEAGCDDSDILAHCRGDGPHVRGCWVVDLVLGKPESRLRASK